MSLLMRQHFFIYRIPLRLSSTESKKIGQDAAKRRSSIDDNEIEHHGKLSELWWNTMGPMRALHAYNPIRVQFIRDGLKNTGLKEKHPRYSLEGVQILDVGCGAGILSEALARIGANVTGIDGSEQLIETAKKHASLDSNLSKNLNYSITSVEDHVADNKSEIYDAVVASEVIEHVSNKDIFVKYCAKALKPGGSIFITTLNKTIPSFLGGIVCAEYILRAIPIGTHEWSKFISPEDTQRLLDQHGCSTQLVHGVFFNPLTNTWSWTSSKNIFYALHAVKSET
ncbi:ubiquinone biosynthesis O-methyltransferase, mitochondrial [Cotesia glomerata]|uniref:Ubiquinone biosynthesis O-methyltransferase, mitochondrial n=1 Tax=Cotesia glomerata TaxID=32391 RepID=A0AAV7ITA3_COTGL|nr:ubiquinone biosynthesis O-methyltransferase, mitochondrial [Cotesia glomerata]XP_044580640.1 ubiquinone biosynthesis O-methyltransferase, mitochondrial [Cotesia glomerata]XP_044580641.1 ubiquinone biosynthesis O-methyltransferase, mitochondrial [Cotesia glomerata]KAH0555514.1 hypothetical protein KQX54_019653 [Cotesia glomerata]